MYPVTFMFIKNQVQETIFMVYVLITVYAALTGFGFVLNLYEFGKITVTIKEKMYYHIYQIYTSIEKYISEPDVKHQNVALKSLKDLKFILGKLDETANKNLGLNKISDECKKFDEIVKMFYNNISKYTNIIENATTGEELRKLNNTFLNLFHSFEEEDFEKLKSILKRDFKKGKTMGFYINRIKNIISLTSVIEYVISISIASALCYVVIFLFNLKLFSDLGSLLSVIVSFFLIVGGIKAIVIEKIKGFLMKSENE